jgi:hypothetical protein
MRRVTSTGSRPIKMLIVWSLLLVSSAAFVARHEFYRPYARDARPFAAAFAGTPRIGDYVTVDGDVHPSVAQPETLVRIGATGRPAKVARPQHVRYEDMLVEGRLLIVRVPQEGFQLPVRLGRLEALPDRLRIKRGQYEWLLVAVPAHAAARRPLTWIALGLAILSASGVAISGWSCVVSAAPRTDRSRAGVRR